MPLINAALLTTGTIMSTDMKYPDVLYIEIQFAKEIQDSEWPSIHRQLQQKYKANFPYDMRDRMWDYPRTYGFVGVREVPVRAVKAAGIDPGDR